MQFMIDFAAEDAEFQNIHKRSSHYSTVQGIVLDVDRFWLRLWSLRDRWGEDRLKNSLYYHEGPFSWWPDAYDCPNVSNGHFSVPSLCDLENWQPPAWKARQKYLGSPPGRLPLIVRVCLRPRLTPEEAYPLVTDLADENGRLQIEIEIRSRAQLSSNPRKAHSPILGGVSIGVAATDYGTLGVILTDANAGLYGLTCSHVAGAACGVKHPSGRDSSSGAIIGQTVASSPLVSCPLGVKCNPWSGVVANEIDASLIQIDVAQVPALLEVLDIGTLAGVMNRAVMATAQPVEVMGRTSGFNSLQIGGLAAWYSFNHDGADYCFKNLFEVESPYGKPGVIQLGDSGAPVCAAGAVGTEWAGMVLGRDAFKGYAAYAQSIQQWLFGKGYTLRVN